MELNQLVNDLHFSNFFWQILTPILFSCFDVITGYLQALINKTPNSSKMRIGLLHKILLILVLLMSIILDFSFNLKIISKFVSIYIIFMEVTSILENISKAGINMGKISEIFKEGGIKNDETK